RGRDGDQRRKGERRGAQKASADADASHAGHQNTFVTVEPRPSRVARPALGYPAGLRVAEVEERMMHVKLDELRGRKFFDANGREIGRVRAALVDMETCLVDTVSVGVSRHAAAD